MTEINTEEKMTPEKTEIIRKQDNISKKGKTFN